MLNAHKKFPLPQLLLPGVGVDFEGEEVGGGAGVLEGPPEGVQ